jgi:hypothetical protein
VPLKEQERPYQRSFGRTLDAAASSHKTIVHTAFIRFETGSHSTKFPLTGGGLSPYISFCKFNAFKM